MCYFGFVLLNLRYVITIDRSFNSWFRIFRMLIFSSGIFLMSTNVIGITGFEKANVLDLEFKLSIMSSCAFQI